METPELHNSDTNGLPDASFSLARLSQAIRDTNRNYRQTEAPRPTPRLIDTGSGEIPTSVALERLVTSWDSRR